MARSPPHHSMCGTHPHSMCGTREQGRAWAHLRQGYAKPAHAVHDVLHANVDQLRCEERQVGLQLVPRRVHVAAVVEVGDIRRDQLERPERLGHVRLHLQERERQRPVKRRPRLLGVHLELLFL
eukprot:5936739-Prymnesium_polylepis.1